MKKILFIITLLLINGNSYSDEKKTKVKDECSKISKFSPKFIICKAGKGAKKMKNGLKLSKIKEAYNNRPTKGKKTLADVFKKEKK